MSRKTYEVSLRIDGKLGGSMARSFSSASAKVDQLKIDLQKLNQQYRKGEIDAENYQKEHVKLKGQMDKERRTIDNLREAQERHNRILQRTKSLSMGVATGFRSMGSSALRLAKMGLIGGGATMAAGGYGLFQLGKKSLTGAASLELQGMQLKALVGDAEKAKKLFDDMNALGMKSVFSEQDFMEGSKTFLPMTKNLDEINKLVRIQERLALSNPTQGMEGAAFAMREAMSGDIISLADRFNISRSALYDAGFDSRSKDVLKNIRALDKVLTKYGFTQEYVTEVNEAALSQWENLKSNLSMKLARSGKKALEELKPFMKDLNTFLASERAARMFDRWGQALGNAAEEAGKLGRWLLDEGGRAFDYLDRNYFSNPKFQKLPFSEKIDVVFNDIERKFDAWYAGSGKVMMEKGAQNFVEFTIGVLEKSLPRITEIGGKVGGALGQGLWDGIEKKIAENPILSVVLSGAAGAAAGSRFGPWGALIGGATGAAGGTHAVGEARKAQKEKRIDDLANAIDKLNSGYYSKRDMSQDRLIDGSHANGLSYVPRDNYYARLHHGERVLTADENKEYATWQRASEKLPSSRSSQPSVIFQFSPNVYGGGPDVQSQISAAQDEFEQRAESWLHQQRRLSYR